MYESKIFTFVNRSCNSLTFTTTAADKDAARRKLVEEIARVEWDRKFQLPAAHSWECVSVDSEIRNNSISSDDIWGIGR